MQWVDCTFERHGEATLAIFNEAIVHSTALYDYKPRSMASMTTWFEAKADGGFPVIGLESDGGDLMGFASYGAFRHWPAYKYTVEHSVYVHKGHQGQGVAQRLMAVLIERTRPGARQTRLGGRD